MAQGDRDPTGVPPVGTVLAGKYEVERVLGAGAMGVVVAARHVHLRQTVALKLVSGTREAHANAVARFTREARAIAALASDHVVRVLDFGHLDERTPFMVMQYLRGRDLASEVRARGRLPQTEAVDYAIQACAGLAVAHAASIVHRDIKPGNLLLTTRPTGEPLVVIVDFGISKTPRESEEELSLTISQVTLGSPLYMSPEQIRDPKAVDARTDVWSLGVVLRFLLTGRPAFAAREASGVLAAVIADEPAPLRDEAPEVDPGLEAVVSRCLQKKAAFRWGSAAELARALAPYGSESAAALATSLEVPQPCGSSPTDIPVVSTTSTGGTFASTTRGVGAPGLPVAKWWAIGGASTALAITVAGGIVLARGQHSSSLRTDVSTDASSFEASPAPSTAAPVAPLPSSTIAEPLLAPPDATTTPRPVPRPRHPVRATPPAKDAGASHTEVPSDPLDTAK